MAKKRNSTTFEAEVNLLRKTIEKGNKFKLYINTFNSDVVKMLQIISEEYSEKLCIFV